MTLYLSNKIRNLSSVSILMVIYIHMYYTEGSSMSRLNFIEHFMGSGLCSVAVPLFYIISGYLFFLSMPKGVLSIKDKLKKRCRTLLVPYLIANILTFIFYLILGLIATKVTLIGQAVNFNVLDIISYEGFWGTLYLVFVNPPIAFQLWFVRDLMCVMLISPLIYISIRQLIKMGGGKLWLIIIGLLFVFMYKTIFVTAFVWFSLGSWLSLYKIDLSSQKVHCLWAFFFLCLYILYSFCVAYDFLPIEQARFIPLIGIPAIWLIYDVAIQYINFSKLQYLTSCSFFIYLIHEPLLNIFKKLPLLVDRGEIILIISYLLTPPIFYLFGCWLSSILKKIIPQAYSIYTGCR